MCKASGYHFLLHSACCDTDCWTANLLLHGQKMSEQQYTEHLTISIAGLIKSYLSMRSNQHVPLFQDPAESSNRRRVIQDAWSGHECPVSSQWARLFLRVSHCCSWCMCMNMYKVEQIGACVPESITTAVIDSLQCLQLIMTHILLFLSGRFQSFCQVFPWGVNILWVYLWILKHIQSKSAKH